MSEMQPCPRCARMRTSNRLGVDWCCWELRLLRDLLARAVPATMRELTGLHFIGRSEKSIDAACRRYGFKIPARGERQRRCRCLACGTLYARAAGVRCCQSCRRPAPVLGEGVAA